MNEYFVYLYTFPNGKYYVGQSSHSSHRFGHVSNYKSSPAVYRAMKKYPNFKKEILVDGLSELEVDEFEKYYIKLYNSLVSENGYNISSGGYTIKKGNIPWNKGKPTGLIPPNKGKKAIEWMKPENIEKTKKNLIPGSKKGRKCNNRKKCFLKDITTNEILEFKSILEAAKFMGYASDKTMSKYYKNNRVMKEKWLFVFDLEEDSV